MTMKSNAGIRLTLTRWLQIVVAVWLPLSAAAAKPQPELRSGDVVVAEGVRIHYVDAGDLRASRTIVLVPGWCTSSAIWRDQIAALSATSRVVSIDPRSQGDSTITTKDNTPEQRARDLHAVLASLGLADVVLVGWSQGVQDLAAYAVAYHGEGVSGYVLVDAPVGAGPAEAVRQPENLGQQLARFAIYERYPKEYLQGMMEAIIRSPAGRAHIDEYVTIGLRTPPDLGISMLIMDFLAVDRRAALESFNRPTLVIAAQSGDVETQKQMAGRIKGSRFETVENAGHALFLDQPVRFRELLEEFVRQTHAQKASASAVPQKDHSDRR